MRRILIAGYGKMGSWLWSLLSKEYELAVLETGSVITKSAPDVNFLKNMADVKSYNPDLFLNCVSISKTLPVFSEMVSILPPECMLADIASVKNGLPDFYGNSGRRFVSLHPMFGPTFSDMSSPGGRTAYLIAESDANGKEFFKTCFEKAGIVIREVGFVEHDKLMATLLSVPVITALLFSAAATERAFPGTTYHRYAAVSGGVMNENAELLRMILSNRFTKEKIAKMADTLSSIAHSLSRDSEPEFISLLESVRDQSGSAPAL
jgi:prephenate dehydrogenase